MGICCKPGSNDKECVNDSDHICSEPAFDSNSQSINNSILSTSNLNH
jgi:hypothetical protein